MAFALIALSVAPDFELSVYPFSPQLNPAWTTHFMQSTTFGWKPASGFALVATLCSSWLAVVSDFNDELVSKARFERHFPTTLTDAYLGLGTELAPLEGELVGLAFAMLVSGGLGLSSTRIQLKPRNDTPATYGATGWRPAWAFGLGARVALNGWLALRIEVMDFVVASGVSNVNGCSRSDLRTLYSATLVGGPGTVSPTCQKDTFRSDDLPLRTRPSESPATPSFTTFSCSSA
jgi:hypothetical protein